MTATRTPARPRPGGEPGTPDDPIRNYPLYSHLPSCRPVPSPGCPAPPTREARHAGALPLMPSRCDAVLLISAEPPAQSAGRPDPSRRATPVACACAESMRRPCSPVPSHRALTRWDGCWPTRRRSRRRQRRRTSQDAPRPRPGAIQPPSLTGAPPRARACGAFPIERMRERDGASRSRAREPIYSVRLCTDADGAP